MASGMVVFSLLFGLRILYLKSGQGAAAPALRFYRVEIVTLRLSVTSKAC